jgi:hypothetical protein
MTRIVNQAKSLLVLVAVLAVAVAACGSSGSTPNSNGGQSAGPSNAVQPTLNGGDNGGDNGGGFGDVTSKFDNVASYKFNMVLAGGSFASSLSVLGSASSDGSFTISGTVITKPDKAADVTMAGIHIIESGGQQCMDMGTGSFFCTPSTGSSMADSFSPSTMFGSMVDTGSGDYKKVGTEQKNGVTADHYQGTEGAYAGLNSLAGVPNATWTADVWIATDGGYPVSTAIVGTADGATVFKFIFDITNINDPANKVTLPNT